MVVFSSRSCATKPTQADPSGPESTKLPVTRILNGGEWDIVHAKGMGQTIAGVGQWTGGSLPAVALVVSHPFAVAPRGRRRLRCVACPDSHSAYLLTNAPIDGRSPGTKGGYRGGYRPGQNG